jgi:signal transduction histidine kinase/DNA-binding NarL/FixJ family response regulator
LPDWYLTPDSINYQAEFILSLVLSVFLTVVVIRERQNQIKPGHGILILMYFWLSALINAVSFVLITCGHGLSSSLLFLRSPFNNLGLLLLLQFAYRFPAPLSRHTRERRIVTAFTCLFYLLIETVSILNQSGILSRTSLSWRLMNLGAVYGLIIAWTLVVFIRQQIETAGLNQPWPRALIRLPSREAQAVWMFALVTAIYYLLGLFVGAQVNHLLSKQFISIAIPNLIMAALCLLAVLYINFLPGTTTFMVKLVGISMVAIFSILGAAGWMMMLSVLTEAGVPGAYQAPRTLEFQPNAQGGYRVSSVPFRFQTPLGTHLDLSDQSYQELNPAFAIPFYGVSYNRVHVSKDGFVSFGGPPGWYENYALNTGSPKIIVFLMPPDPQELPQGGIFVRSEAQRLVITWSQRLLPNGKTASFQLALYPDGKFDLSFEKIPLSAADILEIPFLNSVTGSLTGHPSDQPVYVDLFTALPLEIGAGSGVLDNTYLRLRQFTHRVMLPMAYLLLLASLIVFVVVPFFSWLTLIHPLNILLQGVQRVNDGDLTGEIPIQSQDEIGFLTRSFNHMQAELRQIVTTLEERVRERTRELADANQKLQDEAMEREAAEEMNLQQHRLLATLEERERLGRDLHDSLGQTMGYINVEAQAAKDFLASGEIETAQTSLEQMALFAQSAHNDIRSFILGLRSPIVSENFLSTLEMYLRQLQTNFGIQASLSVPADTPIPDLPPAVEEQILRIVQEALTNVRKHAAAKKVEILLRFTADRGEIIISDDGVGFDRNQPVVDAQDRQFGLEIMRERARQVGGSLEIRSQVGAGAKVLVEFPLQQPFGRPVDEGDAAAARALRILLVDDSPLFLDGLRNLLLARGFIVVGEAQDGLEAQEQARLLQPDLVVMDIHMPNCGGLEATRAIKAEQPGIIIVMLTVSEDDETLMEALRAGAAGYLLKSLEADDFCRLLAGVARGETPLTPGMSTRLLANLTRPPKDGTKVETRSTDNELSPRQWTILELVATGMQYKEVADTLHLSEASIKYHMNQILGRLHLENRQQAISYAIRLKSKKKG